MPHTACHVYMLLAAPCLEKWKFSDCRNRRKIRSKSRLPVLCQSTHEPVMQCQICGFTGCTSAPRGWHYRHTETTLRIPALSKRRSIQPYRTDAVGQMPGPTPKKLAPQTLARVILTDRFSTDSCSLATEKAAFLIMAGTAMYATNMKKTAHLKEKNAVKEALTADANTRLHLPLGLHTHALPAARKHQRRQQGQQ